MEKNDCRSGSVTISEGLSLDDQYSSTTSGRTKRSYKVPRWLEFVLNALMPIIITVCTVLVLQTSWLSPLRHETRVKCQDCDLANSTGSRREQHVKGATICCADDTDQQMSPPVAQPLQDHGAPYRHRRGAQLHLDTDALRGKPSRLAWSVDMSDICYLSGLAHVGHVHHSTTYDCLQVPEEQNYLITTQIVFTNMRSGKVGPEHGSGTFNTYYTVVRFNSSGNFTTIGKVYFTMAKSRTTVKRPGSSIVKEPRLFSRSLHLHEKDNICLTVENLDLVYADPIGSYFGIFEL